MGSALVDLTAEIQALKEILTPNSRYAAELFSACKPDYFYHPTSRAIYKRLGQLLANSKSLELPTLSFVLADSKISLVVKNSFLQAAEGLRPLCSEGDMSLLLNKLSVLAKSRSMVVAAQRASNELIESADPHASLREIADQLGNSILKIDDSDDLQGQVILGAGYNLAAEESFLRILHGTFEKSMIKTGFREFDERTGGHNRTNLVVIAANSGGGKSLFSLNLMVRQYRLGYRVVLASYEMAEDEVMIRLLSCISEIEMTKILNNRLTPHEKQRVEVAYREFVAEGVGRGASFTVICPRSETSVAEIGFRCKSLKPDSLILDYINLLSSGRGSTAEAQWQQLGDVAKDAKLLANKLGCVVYLLAQLDDNYNLRYSKGIKDHANFVMAWVRDETSRIERKIAVRQIKARNAPLYDFELVERFDVAQFRDPGQDDRSQWPSEEEYHKILNNLAEQKALPGSPIGKLVQFQDGITIKDNETLTAHNNNNADHATRPDGTVDFSKVRVPARNSASLLKNHRVEDDSV